MKTSNSVEIWVLLIYFLYTTSMCFSTLKSETMEKQEQKETL